MTELEKLAALQEKATKGPWLEHPNGLGGATTMLWVNDAETPEKGTVITKHVHGVHNAKFVAAARNTDFAALSKRVKDMEDALRYVIYDNSDFTLVRRAREALSHDTTIQSFGEE